MRNQMRNIPNTLTVNQLIEELEMLRDSGDGETPVVMTADYGDYHHTTQALGIDALESREVEDSAYSKSGFALTDDDGDERFTVEDDTERDALDGKRVIALR